MAKVLICDDAVYVRMSIREILEDAGHEVVGEAADGKEAVEMYKKLKPDVVTMDLLMSQPGAGGVRDIKKYDKDAKIIVISVLNEQAAELVAAVKNGAEGLVHKPIKDEVLLAELNRVLEL